MNWHRSPALVERLAADYALGTLAGPARRRFEAVMKTQLGVARAAALWDTRLEPLGRRLSVLPASAELWAQIERRSFGSSAVDPAPASAPARWWKRLLSPTPAATLAFGLTLGLLLPALGPLLQRDAMDAQLPESYVGVLARADGRTGMIVSSRRHGTIVDLKRVQPVPVGAGQTLFLWAIDAGGKTWPIGPVPQGSFVQVVLSQTSETLFARTTELALSIEAAGSAPAQPGGQFAYRGLCGKLWRVKAP